MDVSGISNFARTASTQAAPQNSPSFQELNTDEQRARQDSAQPRNAEAAQSLASENNGRANSFDEQAPVSASSNDNSINDVSQDSNVEASSASRSEDFSISDRQQFDTASPRGSVVDIVV